MATLKRVRQYLLQASWPRTALETSALFALLWFFCLLLYRGPSLEWRESAVTFLVNPLCALYYSLRLRPLRGTWFQQFWRETLAFSVLPPLFACTTYQWLQSLLNTNPNYTPWALVLIFLLMFILPFIFFRGLIRVIMWWKYQSQRTLLFSLVNSHVIVVMLLQSLVLVPLMLLSLGNFFMFEQNEPTQPVVHALYRVQQLLPLFGAMVLLAIIVLALFLPFAFAVSYLFARRIRRRLDQLLLAAHAMRDGDYGARVPVGGYDEISTLQTDFNRMGEQLEQQFRALQAERETVSQLLSTRRELMANVSHELRTPIAIMRAQLEAAERQGSQIDPTVLQTDVLHLQRLVDDLFALAQSETEQLSVRMEPMTVVPILERIVQSFAPIAWRQRKVEVIGDFAPQPPQLQIDQTRFEQIILNLLHNALRHSKPGGIILIRCDVQGQIEVRDTGSGIPADQLPHIWDRYYRDPEQGGTGLGLTLVQSLVQAMGGAITVESKLGEGTCFSIKLPVAS